MERLAEFPWMKTTGKPSVALSSTAMTPCRVSILVVVIGILIVRSARSAGIHATGHMRHRVHPWTSHCARAVGTVTRPTLRTNRNCGIDYMWILRWVRHGGAYVAATSSRERPEHRDRRTPPPRFRGGGCFATGDRKSGG